MSKVQTLYEKLVIEYILFLYKTEMYCVRAQSVIQKITFFTPRFSDNNKYELLYSSHIPANYNAIATVAIIYVYTAVAIIMSHCCTL